MPRVRETEYVDVIWLEQDDGPVQKAVIFQRGEVWSARVTYDGGKTYHRFSTKKRDCDAAKKVVLALKHPLILYDGKSLSDHTRLL